MRKLNTIETARMMNNKDYPEAGPVTTYVEIETVIARNLQGLIKTEDKDQRRGMLQTIVVECCKELERERVK